MLIFKKNIWPENRSPSSATTQVSQPKKGPSSLLLGTLALLILIFLINSEKDASDNEGKNCKNEDREKSPPPKKKIENDSTVVYVYLDKRDKIASYLSKFLDHHPELKTYVSELETKSQKLDVNITQTLEKVLEKTLNKYLLKILPTFDAFNDLSTASKPSTSKMAESQKESLDIGAEISKTCSVVTSPEVNPLTASAISPGLVPKLQEPLHSKKVEDESSETKISFDAKKYDLMEKPPLPIKEPLKLDTHSIFNNKELQEQNPLLLNNPKSELPFDNVEIEIPDYIDHDIPISAPACESQQMDFAFDEDKIVKCLPSTSGESFKDFVSVSHAENSPFFSSAVSIFSDQPSVSFSSDSSQKLVFTFASESKTSLDSIQNNAFSSPQPFILQPIVTSSQPSSVFSLQDSNFIASSTVLSTVESKALSSIRNDSFFPFSTSFPQTSSSFASMQPLFSQPVSKTNDIPLSSKNVSEKNLLNFPTSTGTNKNDFLVPSFSSPAVDTPSITFTSSGTTSDLFKSVFSFTKSISHSLPFAQQNLPIMTSNTSSGTFSTVFPGITSSGGSMPLPSASIFKSDCSSKSNQPMSTSEFTPSLSFLTPTSNLQTSLPTTSLFPSFNPLSISAPVDFKIPSTSSFSFSNFKSPFTTIQEQTTSIVSSSTGSFTNPIFSSPFGGSVFNKPPLTTTASPFALISSNPSTSLFLPSSKPLFGNTPIPSNPIISTSSTQFSFNFGSGFNFSQPSTTSSSLFPSFTNQTPSLPTPNINFGSSNTNIQSNPFSFTDPTSLTSSHEFGQPQSASFPPRRRFTKPRQGRR